MKARLAEAQDDDFDHGKEEEGVLAKAIEGEECAEVTEEDIEGGENSGEEKRIDGGVGGGFGLFCRVTGC